MEKVHLFIRPNFDWKFKEREAGDYLIILPQNNTILWSMWCSSLQWVSTDLTLDNFNKILQDIFERHDCDFEFYYDLNKELNIDELNKLNPQLDLNIYYKNRGNYHIPRWEEIDLYKLGFNF